MSKYTTGELAKLCNVTVRTVQYYDTRGILVPTELSEGGRRLYSEDDLKRMKIICFLRELGLSIDTISHLLCEESRGDVIALLLEQQTLALQEEIVVRKEKLDKLATLKHELKSIEKFSFESIGDIAYTMKHKDSLKKIHRTMLISGIPVGIVQWTAIILLILKGIWWPIIPWIAIAIPYGILISRYYFNHVAYLCPECHKVFQPSLKQAFWAKHTPATRKLTCTACGYRGFCVEVAK